MIHMKVWLVFQVYGNTYCAVAAAQPRELPVFGLWLCGWALYGTQAIQTSSLKYCPPGSHSPYPHFKIGPLEYPNSVTSVTPISWPCLHFFKMKGLTLRNPSAPQLVPGMPPFRRVSTWPRNTAPPPPTLWLRHGVGIRPPKDAWG